MKRLRCSCCLAATAGRQWPNQDVGYGLCPSCGDWIASHRPFGGDPMTAEEITACYGVRGVHWDIQPSDLEGRPNV